MKVLALYLVTGAVTGFQVVRLLMWAVWGAPTSPIQYVSLVGSAVLCVASGVTLFKPRLAAKIALAAVATIWSFYVPALIQSLPNIAAIPIEEAITAMIPVLFLIVCTVYIVERLRRPSSSLPSSTSNGFRT